MIYIKKGRTPASLINYMKKQGAYFDGFPEKDEIRESLLKEQGYLCAYCMRRINKKDMKIEHWIPQNLPQNRRMALNSALMYLSQIKRQGTWGDRLLEKVRMIYSEPDSNGMKKEYSGIVLWYLDNRLKNAKNI